MDELVLDGKTYVSSKRAAKITGYARDYVGQLCREGHVEARLVGRSWYVLESSIREHRFGGEKKAETLLETSEEAKKPAISAVRTWEAPKYVPEMASTLPEIAEKESVNRIDRGNSRAQADDPVAQMQAAWQDWFTRKQPAVLLENEPEELLESPDIIDAREERNEIEAAAASVTPKIATYEAEMQVDEPVILKKVADDIETKREEARSSLDFGTESVNVHKKYPTPATQSTFTPVNRTVKSTNTVDLVRERPTMDRKTRIKMAREKERAQRKQGSSRVLVRIFFFIVSVAAIGEALIGTGYLDQFTSKYVTNSAIGQYLVGERLVNKN